MSVSLPPMSVPGFLERTVAHELGAPVGVEPSSLRARLPYPFEAMRSSEPAVKIADTSAMSVAFHNTQRVASPDAGFAPQPHSERVPSKIRDQPLTATAALPNEVEPTRTAKTPTNMPAPEAIEKSAREREPLATTIDRDTQKPLGSLGGRVATGMSPLRAGAQAQQSHPLQSSKTPSPSVLPVTRAPPITAAPALRAARSILHAPLTPQVAIEPTIEIHIGRLDVRAQQVLAPAIPPSRTPPVRDERLSDYLSRRARGARS